MFQKGSSSSELPSVQIWERKWRGGWIVRVSEPCMPNYDLISSVTIYLTQKKLSPPPKVPKSSHNSVHLNKDVIHTSQKNLRLFLYHNLLPRSFKKSPIWSHCFRDDLIDRQLSSDGQILLRKLFSNFQIIFWAISRHQNLLVITV